MVFIPLNGPDAYDQNGKLKPPKAPSISGWQGQDYQGVDRNYGGWVGLRTDDLVVIDCDTDEAVKEWRNIGAPTFEVKTPRGTHFYYRWSPGSPLGPAVDVLPGIDVRAGRGAQVVVPPTPGYDETGGEFASFDPSWLPAKPATELEFDQGWDTIPEGRRNTTLTAIAGSLRKQGAGAEPIAATIATINARRCVPPLPDDEIVTIVRSVLRYEPDPYEADGIIEIIGEDGEPLRSDHWRKLSMSNMQLPPPPEWWWKPYLPKGRLVLLDGGEGIGKGLFCAWATEKITSGEWSEDGEGLPVLWFAAEDDPAEDVQRRLLAAGYVRGENADVHFIEGLPRFPRDLVELIGEIKAEKLGLIILDPGRSYLGPEEEWQGSWSYNDEAGVRPGLEQLNRVAKASGVTIIFVHHWNKNAQAAIEDRASGSKAFRQIVRHGLSMAWVGDTEFGEGALAVTKSNIGPTGHLRGYSIEADDDLSTARFVLGDLLPDYRMGDFIHRANEEQTGDASIEMDLETVLAALGPEVQVGGLFPSPRELHARFRAHGVTLAQAQGWKREALESGVVQLTGKGQLIYVGNPIRVAIEQARELEAPDA